MNPKPLEPIRVPKTDEIREILARRIDDHKQAIGIVVGVIEPAGRRVVAYGNLAKGDARSLDGDTIFEIGSVSKVFTSLLLADMVKREEIGLNDAAGRYLPEHVKLPERNGKSITPLDLSTHYSGLPVFPNNLKLNLTQGEIKDADNPYAFYSVEDLYEFLAGYTLPRDPSSEFEYSNLAAGLLGHLLAYRAGMDFESLIRSRITGPLAMADTGITLSSSQKQRMATGHRANLAPVNHKTWDSSHGLSPAGAVRSCANDVLTFLEAFLGYRESPLRSAMKAMLEVRRPAGQAEIGLGWFVSANEGREIAWHNGGTFGGFRSFAGFDPEERIGVVVLSNAFTRSGVDDIGFHLLNPRLPLANVEPPKQHTEIHIEPELLNNYTGRYQLTPNLIFEITRDGGRLFAQGFAQVGGRDVVLPRFELFGEGGGKFFARVTDKQISFETGADGRAISFVLYQAGREPVPAARLP